MNNQQHLRDTSRTFYINQKQAQPAQYIYDETYHNIKRKHQFSKDPKFTYFNALMHMKNKLSQNQDVYKKVFQNDGRNNPEPQNKTFYVNSLYKTTPTIRIQKLRNNSYKIYKDATINQFKNTKTSDRLNSTHIKMDFKGRSTNSTHFDLEVSQNINLNANRKQVNPKPRLDQIMAEYRRIHKVTQRQNNNKKTSLSKQIVQKFLSANYTNNQMKIFNSRKKSAF